MTKQFLTEVDFSSIEKYAYLFDEPVNNPADISEGLMRATGKFKKAAGAGVGFHGGSSQGPRIGGPSSDQMNNKKV